MKNNNSIEDFKLPIFLRYPGGKRRQINYFIDILPSRDEIEGKYFEPFLGGGTVFFKIRPYEAILSDLSSDLIELYQAIKENPKDVWGTYLKIPEGKKTYYYVRNNIIKEKNLTNRAAKILYLNRTCFKGMWRYNSKGIFNVGYGGEDRRWTISENDLINVSTVLKGKKLLVSDFEDVINSSKKGDFLFLDPPYQPGKKNLINDHFNYSCFLYKDQIRLSKCLQKSSKRGVKWAMTNSDSNEILNLYKDSFIFNLSKRITSEKDNLINREILITNYVKGENK